MPPYSRRALRRFLVLVPLLVSCVAPEPIGEVREAVVVPGPWVAPPAVAAIAATHFIPVVDPPPVSPAGSCSSTNPFTCSCRHPACIEAYPGTNELREYLLARFPDIRNSGTFCCRQNSNRRTHLSVHAIGRAIDLGVTTIGGDANNTVGDPVANFLVENAEYIGIQRVIWDYTFWNGERGFGRLGGDPHVNHLHIELTQQGADRQTPFFTIGAPGEVCTPSCEGGRYIDEACNAEDCAAIGAECLPDPPRCGEPPPPEPPASVPVAGAAFPAVTPIGNPGRVTFVGPERQFDTRASMDGLVFDDTTSELTWTSGLEDGVDGIFLNLAAVASEPGFVSVFPDGSARPGTSNLNVSLGARANLVPTPLGDGGAVRFFQASPVELIGDLFATFGAAGDGLELIDPTRVLDSRATSTPLLADEVVSLDVGGPDGTTGVLATVVALNPAENSFLSVFPCGVETDSSTVNVLADEIASNQVVSALGEGDAVCLRALRDMDVIFDVLGYFSAEGTLEYQPVTPIRLVDTRNAVAFENRLAAHQTIDLDLSDVDGMPDNAWAAVLNVATVEADGPGHLRVFACERGTAPGTSAHNFGAEVRATLTTSDLGASRRACVNTSTRTHVVVDLLGVWRRGDGAPPPAPPPTPDPEGEGLDEEMPDGGPGPGSDGGTVDGGVEPSDGGCSCRAGARPRPTGTLGLLLFGAVLVVRRRRR